MQQYHSLGSHLDGSSSNDIPSCQFNVECHGQCHDDKDDEDSWSERNLISVLASMNKATEALSTNNGKNLIENLKDKKLKSAQTDLGVQDCCTDNNGCQDCSDKIFSINTSMDVISKTFSEKNDSVEVAQTLSEGLDDSTNNDNDDFECQQTSQEVYSINRTMGAISKPLTHD